MKRKSLLELGLQEEKNVTAKLEGILEEDAKFIKRAKRDLEDKAEDLESSLKKRLSSELPLDKAVIEVMYAELLDTERTLAIYNSFEEDYL